MANRKATVGRPKGAPKTGGRKQGTPNKVTVEVRQAAAEIVDNPQYRKNLLDRALKNELAPAIEAMLWAYAKGKPKEQVDVQVDTVSRIVHEHLVAEPTAANGSARQITENAKGNAKSSP